MEGPEDSLGLWPGYSECLTQWKERLAGFYPGVRMGVRMVPAQPALQRPLAAGERVLDQAFPGRRFPLVHRRCHERTPATELLENMKRNRSSVLRSATPLILSAAALVLGPAASAGISDGLVVHLTFDNTLNDASGRANHGTAVGSPRFVAGRVGSHAAGLSSRKDGTGFDYVALGTPADLAFGTATRTSR